MTTHNPYTPVLTGILQQVTFVHQAAAAVFLREAGMPLARCRILLLVRETGGCTQKYLTERTRVDPAAMTRQLGALEEAGLVHRMDDPRNRRRSLVALTAKGMAEAEAVSQKREEFLKGALAGVSREERETASAMLGKILANLDACEGGGSPRVGGGVAAPQD